MLFHQMRGKEVQVKRLINQLQNILNKTLILADTENLHSTLEYAKKNVFCPLKWNLPLNRFFFFNCIHCHCMGNTWYSIAVSGLFDI